MHLPNGYSYKRKATFSAVHHAENTFSLTSRHTLYLLHIICTSYVIINGINE